MTSQDNALQSGEDQTPLVDVSSTPDVAKDGDAVPPSSIPAGPAGPVTWTSLLQLCRLSLQALMHWLGLILSPHLLQRHLRTTFAIQDICLQTQPRPFRSLPLWSHFPSWSRCRKAFPGPFLPLKAQVGLPGLLLRCKVPIISSRTASLDPWSWPGRGSDVPAFNLPWWHLVPPPPSAGAPAMTFQRQPPCWTSYVADDSRTSSEKSLS